MPSMENPRRRSAEAVRPASSCRPPSASAWRLRWLFVQPVAVCQCRAEVHCSRLWCRKPKSPKLGSPPLFSQRPLRMWMISLAEKTKGYAMKKPILQWPAAGNWDWEKAGQLFEAAWWFYPFFFFPISLSESNRLSSVTFIIKITHS